MAAPTPTSLPPELSALPPTPPFRPDLPQIHAEAPIEAHVAPSVQSDNPINVSNQTPRISSHNNILKPLPPSPLHVPPRALLTPPQRPQSTFPSPSPHPHHKSTYNSPLKTPNPIRAPKPASKGTRFPIRTQTPPPPTTQLQHPDPIKTFNDIIPHETSATHPKVSPPNSTHKSHGGHFQSPAYRLYDPEGGAKLLTREWSSPRTRRTRIGIFLGIGVLGVAVAVVIGLVCLGVV